MSSATVSVNPPVRLCYVDDSGAAQTGYLVYAWIECTFPAWRDGLRGWLDLRKDFLGRYRIPPHVELHATHFAGGRGNPSTDPEWNRVKAYRHEAMERALAAIGALGPVGLGVAFRRTDAVGRHFFAQGMELYGEFVRHLDDRLVASDEYAGLIMDGDGSATYRHAHRALKLDSRRVIEDPMFAPSHHSHWVQMADLVAWTAYQGLLRHPGKAFAWDWYDRFLRHRDVNGGPLQL